MAWRGALMLLIALIGVPARADGTADARELYQRGAFDYNMQRWQSALEAFEASYGAYPDPATLFNIAQCQRQLGLYEAAGHSYRAFIAAAPDDPNRASAERLASQVEAEARRRAAASSGRKSTQPTESINGAVAVEARARAAAPVRRPRGKLGIALGAAGLAAALGGAALLVASASADTAAAHASYLPEQNRQWDRGGELQLGGIVTLAAGGAAAIAGGVLLGLRR